MTLINHHKIIYITVFAVIIPAIFAFFFFTRYNHIPVSMALGECKMDYTSPSSYGERLSPLESTAFNLKGWEMLICYGSPSVNGRKMIGDRIPLDQPWRFGANEPTRFYTTADVELGGVYLPKGRYSIYVVPGRFEWEVVINTSVSHWGNNFSQRVLSKKIGSFNIEPEYMIEPVEKMVITTSNIQPGDNEGAIIFEWEQTRFEIPVINLEEEDKTDYTMRSS
ncbi:MAG: DUF2911 domain-containing protein [Balneolales bacterium]|nr:DUF2911 domain-containing protein [Balneolales bacterium]